MVWIPPEQMKHSAFAEAPHALLAHHSQGDQCFGIDSPFCQAPLRFWLNAFNGDMVVPATAL